MLRPVDRGGNSWGLPACAPPELCTSALLAELLRATYCRAASRHGRRRWSGSRRSCEQFTGWVYMSLRGGHFLRETPAGTLTHTLTTPHWLMAQLSWSLCHIGHIPHPVLCICRVCHQYTRSPVYSACCPASRQDGRPRGGRGALGLVPHFIPRSQHNTHSRCPRNSCGCRFANYLPALHGSWFPRARLIPVELAGGLLFSLPTQCCGLCGSAFEGIQLVTPPNLPLSPKRTRQRRAKGSP